MKPFTIAGIQMRVPAIHTNLKMMKIKLDITMSLYPSVDMVAFSELCGCGPHAHFAQTLPGEFESEMQEMAQKYKIWLLPGSFYEKAGDKIYNTLSVISPEGVVVSRYRKMFPFYPYENEVTPGTDYCIFDVPEVGKFGVLVCYDMWFPETVRTLAAMGAEAIIHPTMTATMDRKIELAMDQTHAATNQCYFFDINGLESGGLGKSRICSPDGRILYQAGSTEEIIPVEIDLERVRRSREMGVMRMGQPLKSFRDHRIGFPIYQKGIKLPYLESLGPVKKPDDKHRLDNIKNKKLKEDFPGELVGYKGEEISKLNKS